MTYTVSGAFTAQDVLLCAIDPILIQCCATNWLEWECNNLVFLVSLFNNLTMSQLCLVSTTGLLVCANCYFVFMKLVDKRAQPNQPTRKAGK